MDEAIRIGNEIKKMNGVFNAEIYSTISKEDRKRMDEINKKCLEEF
jgi:sRNA-binding carbon storage regulator CsrA